MTHATDDGEYNHLMALAVGLFRWIQQPGTGVISIPFTQNDKQVEFRICQDRNGHLLLRPIVDGVAKQPYHFQSASAFAAFWKDWTP